MKPAQPVEPKLSTPTSLMEGHRRLVINKLEPIFYSAKANHFISLQKFLEERAKGGCIFLHFTFLIFARRSFLEIH